ncbi:zinc CCHC-type-like protein, partial [Trifolium medium]|nr:zinc CCHC-type-like protein [Trifolium medium]
MEQNKGLIVDEVEAYKDGLFCRTLAVKLWTNTNYNAKAFKQTTIQSWKLKNPVEVQDLNKNLYLFRFSTKKDAENVLKNGPWSFDKNLIILQKIT